jgi:hypothetical protein
MFSKKIKENERKCRNRFAVPTLLTLLCFGQVFMEKVLEMAGTELVANMERKRDKRKVQ